MMTYRIFFEEMHELLSETFFAPMVPEKLEVVYDNRNIFTDFGMCRYWVIRGTNLSVVRFTYKFGRDVQVVGNIGGSAVSMCFMLNGTGHYSSPELASNEMRQHFNNLFFIRDMSTSYLLKKDETVDCLKIFCCESHLEKLAIAYPGNLNDLMTRIHLGKSFELGDKHFTTSHDMNKAIHDIENSRFMGNCSQMYLESKIQELLAMQLIQHTGVPLVMPGGCMLRHAKEIEEARKLLEQHFLKPPTLHDLALKVGLSETLLKLGFRHFHHQTVYGYLHHYQMNIAQQLLRNTTLTLADVAEQTGYEYQSHFSTAFKRMFGISPLQYRKDLTSKSLIVKKQE